MQPLRRTQIIRKGTLTVVLRGVVMLAKVLVLVLIVRRVGQAGFGVYTLVLFFPERLNIFESGLGAYITRELSAKSHEAKDGAFDELLSTGAFTMLLVALASAGAMWVALFTFFDSAFNIPAEIAPDIVLAKHAASLGFVFVFGNMFCQRVLAGLHAFEIARLINLFTTLAQLAAVAMLVDAAAPTARNINVLAAIWTGTAAFTLAVNGWSCRRRMPCAVTLSPRQVRRATARDSAAFAWPLMAGKVLGFAIQKVDVWIVAAFLGPVAVAVLDVAKRITVMGRQLISELTATVFPFAARLMSTEPDRIRAFVRDGTYYVFGLAGALGVTIAGLAPPYIVMFLGPEYGESIVLLWIFIAAIILVNLASCGSQVLLSMGLYRYTLIPFAIGAAISVGLQFLLVSPLGPLGVALGVAIGMTVRTAGMLWMEHRKVPGGMATAMKHLTIPAAFLAPAAAFAVLNPWMAEADTLLELAGATVAWLGFMGAGVLVFILQKEDRRLLTKKALAMARDRRP